MLSQKKINLGCGHRKLPGWINHDIVPLPGVDVTHDLTKFPWPWENCNFDEINMTDVLEHLPDTLKTLEEIYRITKPGAKCFISVPYWNSWESVTDPTHVRQFNELSFDYFDPTKWRCQNREYYTNARFYVKKIDYYIAPFGPYFVIRYIRISNKYLKRIFAVLASYLNNIIVRLDFTLERAD